MMVSYIQSNYPASAPASWCRHGISLQNRGYGFVLRPGHANVVAPRKRPFHTIIPGFVTQDGKPVMSFGVMGGSMQAQGHAQVMMRFADYQQNPQAAADAPRWRVGPGPRRQHRARRARRGDRRPASAAATTWPRPIAGAPTSAARS